MVVTSFSSVSMAKSRSGLRLKARVEPMRPCCCRDELLLGKGRFAEDQVFPQPPGRSWRIGVTNNLDGIAQDIRLSQRIALIGRAIGNADYFVDNGLAFPHWDDDGSFFEAFPGSAVIFQSRVQWDLTQINHRGLFIYIFKQDTATVLGGCSRELVAGTDLHNSVAIIADDHAQTRRCRGRAQ